MPSPELLQFRYSHFNEKARWGLDWKGVAHERTSLLPGPHAGRVRRLTGQTSVPVVIFEDGPVHGSAAILEALEERYPQPPLFPREASELAAYRELAAHFDEVVAPAVRRALFFRLQHNASYMCRMFAEGQPGARRWMYRALLPFAMGKIRNAYQLDDPVAAKRAEEILLAALDEVASRTRRTGYLLGDRFTAADLTAAAILAVCCDPPGSTMERPVPQPEALASFTASVADHPAIAWVLEMYERHRRGAGARAQ